MKKIPVLLIPKDQRGLDLLGRLEALARKFPEMVYGEAAAEIRRLRRLVRNVPRPRTRGTSRSRGTGRG
jgi:hypothetical protein